MYGKKEYQTYFCEAPCKRDGKKMSGVVCDYFMNNSHSNNRKDLL
jgi:hypothetical protein